MSMQEAAAPECPGSRWYRGLMAACGAASAVLFGAMALLVCADVLMRNTGLGTLPWAVEGTEYMLMVATFLGAPWLLHQNGHIRIDMLVKSLPAAAARWLDAVTDFLGLAICAVLAWQAVRVAQDAAEQGGLVFKVLVFPEWWLNLPMLAACVLLAVEFARRLRRSLGAGAA